MRVVVDTNVIVSGSLRTSGAPANALATNRDNEVTWITSEILLAELQRVLARPRIRRRLKWDDARITQFSDVLRRQSVVVAPSERIEASRDPDDNRVLEAAVAGEADYKVAGDRDLLALGSYEGIAIVTPARFVELLPLDGA